VAYAITLPSIVVRSVSSPSTALRQAANVRVSASVFGSFLFACASSFLQTDRGSTNQ